MLRAGLFVALLVAGATPELAGAGELAISPGVASGASFPEPGFTRPIDLSTGFRGLAPPAMAEPTFPRQRDDALPVQPEFPGPLSGVLRRGIGTANKHQHAAMFRLHGFTLFGGDISGSVDGRSAHVMLSWPTNF